MRPALLLQSDAISGRCGVSAELPRSCLVLFTADWACWQASHQPPALREDRRGVFALESVASAMATFTPISRDQAEGLVDAFDLGRLVAITPIAAGSVNSNFTLEVERDG